MLRLIITEPSTQNVSSITQKILQHAQRSLLDNIAARANGCRVYPSIEEFEQREQPEELDEANDVVAVSDEFSRQEILGLAMIIPVPMLILTKDLAAGQEAFKGALASQVIEMVEI